VISLAVTADALMKRMDELVGSNANAPLVFVRHGELDRTDGSKYRSTCPKCKLGTLLVQRDSITTDILRKDRCLLCGQRVIYTDESIQDIGR